VTKDNVLSAERLNIWSLIISFPIQKEDQTQKKISNCYAENATWQNWTESEQIIAGKGGNVRTINWLLKLRVSFRLPPF